MMQTILSEGKLAAKALASAPACLFLQAIQQLSDNNNAMPKAIRARDLRALYSKFIFFE